MSILSAILSKLRGPSLRDEAESFGIPYEDARFWPPYHISFRQPMPKGQKVLTELYRAKVGDLVDVFAGAGLVHSYLLKGCGNAPGNDHIVSPREFWIEYRGTRAASEPSHG